MKENSMKLTEADKAMGEAYRKFKADNGGHKTAPKGKYGFKSLQFKVEDSEGKVLGPFLGRGSALMAFKNEIKLKGLPTTGVKFIVEEIFRHKAKDKAPSVDGVIGTFELK
jgi:hypothetical protein